MNDDPVVHQLEEIQWQQAQFRIWDDERRMREVYPDRSGDMIAGLIGAGIGALFGAGRRRAARQAEAAAQTQQEYAALAQQVREAMAEAVRAKEDAEFWLKIYRRHEGADVNAQAERVAEANARLDELTEQARTLGI